MVEFIQDDDRLRDERKKAKKNKNKYTGIQGSDMGSGMRYSKYLLVCCITYKFDVIYTDTCNIRI
jgi:hypothetical protein